MKNGKLFKMILMSIMPVLIVVILAASLVAVIWDGIVTIISNVVQNVASFLGNLWANICEVARQGRNAINKMLDTKSYASPATEEITITLPEEYVNNMKQSLDSQGINLDAAGLDDMMLKKMVLTSFKTMATKDTEIAMQVTDEQYKDLKKESSKSEFYRMKMEDGDGNKHPYIATKGIVSMQMCIKDKNGNDVIQDMYCYTRNTLNRIIADYNNATEDSDYYEAIKRVLDCSYTVEDIGSIKVNSQQSSEIEEEIKVTYTTSSNVDDNVKDAKISNKNNSNKTTNETDVKYSEDIAEYTMPMEFLSTLLEMTASPDFVLGVCGLVEDSDTKVVLYPDTRITKEVNEKKYNVDLDILAYKDSYESHQIVKNSKVVSTVTTTKKSTTYNAVVKSVKSWWCTATVDVDKESDNTTVEVDKDGVEVEIDKKSKKTWSNGANEDIITTIDKPWSYYNKSNIAELASDLTIDNADDLIRKKILEVEYNARDKNTSNVRQITENRKNVKNRNQIDYKLRKYNKKATQFEDNTQGFLKLLRGDDGKPVQYKDLYGSDKAEPGELLANGDEMLFAILESFDSTKGTSYIMRYIMYLYSSKDYGITDINQLLEVFNMTISISSNTDLLKEYLHYWENAGGAPTNADGTMYKIESDGYGHPTVGYGIDIENSGFKQRFIDAGYPTTIGGYVPVEFVDALEEEEIRDKMSFVKATTSYLNLTEYQVIALVSRLYNTGNGGITKNYHSPVGNFAKTYSAYWKDSDDQFEAKNPNANFSHQLYTTYMYYPVTSNGTFSKGLERRRKSEWTAFQTGYFDVLDKWYTVSSGGSIIECADMIHKYMEANNYTYCVYGGNSGEECGTYRKSHGLSRTFEASKSNKNTCCATYVSWVLQEAGYLSESEHQDGANNLTNLLISKGWTKITNSSQFQAGDILTYNHHVEIYAGDGKIYNAGSGRSIRGASPGNVYRTCTLALRAPN